MIADEVLASGGAFSLVPVSHGPALAWGWMPGIVAASVASHPQVDEQMLGADTVRGMWLTQARRLLHVKHEALLDSVRWSDIWVWRLERPAVHRTQQVALSHWWPQAGSAEHDGKSLEWAIPDCFSLHAIVDGVLDVEEASTTASLPG